MKEKIKLLKKHGFMFNRKLDEWEYFKRRKILYMVSTYALKRMTYHGVKNWIDNVLGLPIKHKRKYKSGSQIKSFCILLKLLNNNEYIMLRGKPIHPGFMVGMSIATVRGLISKGILFKAIKIRR